MVVEYTRQHRPIEHVTLLKAEADKLHRAAIKPLNGLVPGQTIYVILRSYYDYDSAGPNDQPGFDSESLVIPNKHEVTHVVKTKVTIAETAKTNTNLEDSFGAKYSADNNYLRKWTYFDIADVPQPYMIVTDQFVEDNSPHLDFLRHQRAVLSSLQPKEPVHREPRPTPKLFYAVKRGRDANIYTSWQEAE